VQKCSQQEYQEVVQKTVRFLRGQDKEIVKELYQEMEKYSDALEFERAQGVLEKIRHIEKTIERQFVDTPLGEDLDAIGIYREGEEVVATVLFYRGGRLVGSRHYKFHQIGNDDPELLEAMLMQLYLEGKSGAKEILLPVQILAPSVISALIGLSIHTPQKGVKRTYVEMAEINAEAEFKKGRDENAQLEQTLLQMQETLGLTHFPKRIECFDTSHLFGENPVASQITFINGKKHPASYRKYKIKGSKAGDDYAMMGEVLKRRISRGEKEGDLPDLIVVDGGKGQLGVAQKVLREFNIIHIDLVALAKEHGLHTKGMTREELYLPNQKEPIRLSRHSGILFFLQNLRDEPQRFAIGKQRGIKNKDITTTP
jgi:excinuclease ABC subunit C